MQNKSPFAILAATEPATAAIERILQRCARSERGPSSNPILRETHGWDAEFYQLHLSTAFRSLNEEAKSAVLRDCSRKNLEEALMVEVAGMSYTAKMSLLAENLAQRELYSHFAADEANHFRMIRDLVGFPESSIVDENPFLKFLGLMIEEESRASLILLIQVILEGWGIPYYARLAEKARHEEVSLVLHKIVADEAKHHGSGLILFNESRLSPEEMNRLESRMTELLGMLRMGPSGVVLSLARALGGMTATEIATYLEQTVFQEKLRSDLALIRLLLDKAGATKTAERLRERGLFELPSTRDCADRLAELVRKAA